MNKLTATSEEFLAQFDELFKKFDYDQYPTKSMSKADWKKLGKAGIFLPIIPKAYGGRENHKEIYLIMEKAAFYNAGLAMYITTPMLLFVRCIVGHGSERLKKEVINDLLNNGTSGGFAVIEPDTGTGTVLMQTYFEQLDGEYRITGRKHWQGLSESAKWWLVIAKNKLEGAQGRKFDAFVCNRSSGFVTKQRYDSVGLKLIDFGLNELDVTIPEDARLNLDSFSYQDLLHYFVSGAWGQWASFGSGFLTRVYQEVVNYTTQRPTLTGTLKDIEFIRYRIGTISSSRNLCRALFNYMVCFTNLLNKETEDMFVAQSAKALSADTMFNATLSYQDICGGDGYRYNAKGNIAAYAMQDAKAFSILGVANDLLYKLLTQGFLDLHTHQKEESFYSMIKSFKHTSRGSSYLQADHQLFEKLPVTNNEMIFAGRILARLFGINAIELCDELSSSDKSAAIALCRSEIAKNLAEFPFASEITIEQ